MKKAGLILIAVLMVHMGFACKLAPPPPTKINPSHCTRTDSVENKCNNQRDKASMKEAAPEKKKPHYRRIVIILV